MRQFLSSNCPQVFVSELELLRCINIEIESQACTIGSPFIIIKLVSNLSSQPPFINLRPEHVSYTEYVLMPVQAIQVLFVA